jgi:prepilin peptidase dependent protein B
MRLTSIPKRVYLRWMLSSRGFTLVELMVGLTVSLLVSFVVIVVFLSILRSSDETLSAARLNQELRAAMIVLTADLKRAGYWNSQAVGAADENPAPLVTLANSNSCVVYAYDRNENGQIDPEENFGFRHDVDNGSLLIRAGADPDGCGGNSGWEILVGDSGIAVLDVLFDTDDAAGNPLPENYIRVVLTGQRTDTAAGVAPTITLAETVFLRNAEVLVGP